MGMLLRRHAEMLERVAKEVPDNITVFEKTAEQKIAELEKQVEDVAKRIEAEAASQTSEVAVEVEKAAEAVQEKLTKKSTK